MYCKVCGEKLEIENQKFCQNCGSPIERTKYPSGTIKTPPVIEFSNQEPVPQSTQVPKYTRVIKMGDSPGINSKRALGFGIVSLVLGTQALAVGVELVGATSLLTFLPYGGRNLFIGFAIVHAIGIIFGIISVFNTAKARRIDLDTGILKAGNIVGVIGLLINCIFLLVVIALIP